MDGNISFLIVRKFFRICDGFRLRVEEFNGFFSAGKFYLPFSVGVFCDMVVARLIFCIDWRFLFV